MTVQEWLGHDNQLGIDIWERKYKYNNIYSRRKLWAYKGFNS